MKVPTLKWVFWQAPVLLNRVIGKSNPSHRLVYSRSHLVEWANFRIRAKDVDYSNKISEILLDSHQNLPNSKFLLLHRFIYNKFVRNKKTTI